MIHQCPMSTVTGLSMSCLFSFAFAQILHIVLQLLHTRHKWDWRAYGLNVLLLAAQDSQCSCDDPSRVQAILAPSPVTSSPALDSHLVEYAPLQARAVPGAEEDGSEHEG
ncbi:hypothetical protein C8Q76DRAFT_706042 [Earliella scabrosa]|nr:hypothetical protein C8Q76DRAFT_706042 [Earliella scabrosa]